MLREDKIRRNPSHFIDPVDKTTLIEIKGKIEKCLAKHFSDIDKDNLVSHRHQTKVKTFLDNIKNNKVPTQNMFSLEVKSSSIETILKGLQSGKAVGPDGIPNEFLKYGGDIMISSFADLFTAVTDLETIPLDWQRGIIVPIYKSGSVHDIDNYRGITLTSNMYKVYSKVLEENIMTFLEDNNILGESQGAFRRDRRIEDHLFTLNGICSLRKSSKLKTCIAFLDLSKVFDRVWREGLFYLL